MAVKQTKKLSAATTVSTVNSTDKFPLVDSNGKVTLATLETLKASILDGMNLNALESNTFIMYHRKSDDSLLASKVSKWVSLQSGGEVADGVLLVEGGKMLVVAPTEASGINWSSADIAGGGTTSTNRLTALADWDGQTNTAAQIAASKDDAVTDTASYAPGFCHLYSRENANGKGLTAGKWWLPSLGEMMMIYANMEKVNYALSLISGATQLSGAAYWTSTEYSAKIAWRVSLSNGHVNINAKATSTYRVRAVSAFIP